MDWSPEGPERLRMLDGIAAIHEAATLEQAARALLEATRSLIDCDHCGYHEIDEHFGRTLSYFSAREVEDQVERRFEVWQHYFPTHPVLQFRKANPETTVVRLSDVVDLSDFYRTGIYCDLFTEVDTRNQVTMHLGFHPGDRTAPGAMPLTLGVSLNRSGSDFGHRDLALLAELRRLARPVLRAKRAEYHLRLMYRPDLDPDMVRGLMALGLTDRQSEVAFWMLKGKSNSDIATILGIGAQTVRHHTIAIFARLGVDGRLSLQQRLVRAVLDSG